MPRISVTSHVLKYVSCPPAEIGGSAVRESMKEVFREYPQLAGYMLNDEGRLRTHIVVFIDGQMTFDRNKLSDAVDGSSETYVLQELLGG